jgi:hypothetical protein
MSELALPAIGPVTLAGRHGCLAPLSAAHQDGLAAAAKDGDLSRLWYIAVPRPAQMQSEIAKRLG